MCFRQSWYSTSTHVCSANFCATRNGSGALSACVSWRRPFGLFCRGKTFASSTCFISRQHCHGLVVCFRKSSNLIYGKIKSNMKQRFREWTCCYVCIRACCWSSISRSHCHVVEKTQMKAIRKLYVASWQQFVYKIVVADFVNFYMLHRCFSFLVLLLFVFTFYMYDSLP